MQRTLRRTAAPLVALGLALTGIACGSGKKSPVVIPPPEKPKPLELPLIPARIETTASAPMAANDPASASPILAAMTAENDRWMTALRTRPVPAYYLSYQIIEQRTVTLEAEGGALISDEDETGRNLDLDVRVGSPTLDNTRPITADGLNEPLQRRGFIPFGVDAGAIEHHLWLETDRRYREAALALDHVQQDQSTLARRGKPTAPDFAAAPAVIYSEPEAPLTFDKAAWIARLKACSAKALTGEATRGTCSVVFTRTTAWFVNSEGSQIQQSWTSAQLAVSVGVKADDGMNLNRLEQRFGVGPADLPGDDEVERMIGTVTGDLDALTQAPLAGPYVGPAILEGRAAGVFFHEVFGHRIEGHRQKDETSGKTFSSYVGQPIAPDWLSVYDDAELRTLNGKQLNGFYRFDDEGVAARRVPLVTDGTLVGFLLGRNPILGFPTSNGHGRKAPGLPAVARQGNLVVEAARSVERADLEKMLIAELDRQCTELKQCRDYGMIFTDISGGFTNTSAFAPQAFKVNPVMAFRLYKDGRRELVRGIDIGGTPLAALQSIRAASREIETFNGVCGAESGWVPVSASAPSLLVEKLEIESSFTPQDRPPILAPPSIRTTAPTGVTP